jgi:hypothetical protein
MVGTPSIHWSHQPMFFSKAKNASEFRREIDAYLQQQITSTFNHKRALERDTKSRKCDIKQKAIEFNTLCNVRDFINSIYIEDSSA